MTDNDTPLDTDTDVSDVDTPVDGAQPRSEELIDALEEVKDTPPEPGGDWPDIGDGPGGHARAGADQGVTPDEDDEKLPEGPLSDSGGQTGT